MSENVGTQGVAQRFEEVERIEAGDADTFEQDIIRSRRPVVVRGWLDSWDALRKWSLDYFADRCGSNEVRLRYIGRDDVEFRALYRETTVREWLAALARGEGDELYLAEAPLGQTFPQVVSDIQGYPYGNQNPAGLNLMMGTTTYAPMHFHAKHDAVAAMVVGTKQFILFSPQDSRHLYPQPWYGRDMSFSNVDLSDPDEVDLERFPRFTKAKGLECTLTPGDALFIPMHWWHAVRGGGEFNVLLTDFYFTEATSHWTYPFPGLRLWAQKLGLTAAARSVKSGTFVKDVARNLARVAKRKSAS